MASASIDEEVIAFVAEQLGYSTERLQSRSTLFGDLGIDGDDGHDLLTAFTKRFSIDMRTYRGDRHFGIEGFPPWTPIFWLVLAWRAYSEKESTPESRARLVPITIQNLIDSVKAGEWTVVYKESA